MVSESGQSPDGHGERASELSSESAAPVFLRGMGGVPSCPQWGMQCPATHDDVSSLHELQPGLKDEDVQQVNEVTQVVHQQPVVDVCCSLVGESPADRDQPAVPVPGHDNEEQPQHVHQICAQGPAPPSAGHTSLLCVQESATQRGFHALTCPQQTGKPAGSFLVFNCSWALAQ